MFHPTLHPTRVLLLVTLAVALGVALVQLTPGRGTPTIAAAAAPQGSPVPAPPVTTADAAPVIPPAAASTEAEPVGQLVADGSGPAVAPAPDEQRRGGVACAQPHLLARIDRDVVVRAQPGGRQVGSVPATSAYLGQPTVAWVQATSANGRWGKVTLPWSKPVGRTGWISLDGIATTTTTTMLVADLSRREATAYRRCRPLFSVRTAIGRPGSPSPTGRFWVSDRVAVPAAQQDSFGTFAFGLSTVQPHLPAGWTGGDQMAIHGTGAPGSIGEAASAGCLRVSEDALRRLKPLLEPGTPIIIQA